MNTLTVTTDVAATPWTEAKNPPPIEATLDKVGRLPRGMASGASSVALLLTLPDGRRVIAQTSMANFLTAAAALTGAEQRAADNLKNN